MLQQVGGGNRIWARPFGWHADDIGLQGGAALLKGRARLFNFKTIYAIFTTNRMDSTKPF